MKKKVKRLLKNTTGCKSRIKLVTQTGGHMTTVFQHAHPNRDIIFSQVLLSYVSSVHLAF